MKRKADTSKDEGEGEEVAESKDKEKEEKDDDKEEKEEKEKPAKKMKVLASKIKIQSLELKADCVTLINLDLVDHDISKWTLQSEVGSQSFTFGDKSILKAGDTVTVWSGAKNKDKDNPPNSIFWTAKYIWNDKGDTAVVKDSNGVEIDRKVEKPVTATANIVIAKLDLIADYVSIANRGGDTTDLKGWFIKSCVGDGQHFVFPEGTELAPGQTITVWSGKNSDKRHNPPFSLSWTKRFIWNNKGDNAALYNSDGDLVDKVMQFPDDIKHHINPPKETRK